MCSQDVRPHRCRHCGASWPKAEPLDTCADADAMIQTQGSCAPIAKLLRDAGHPVAVRRSPAPVEDMCAECKKAHVREWRAELLGKFVGGVVS